MGLVGATRSESPKRYLLFIAVLQFAMCFLPLAFDKFIEYFEFFLGVVGGVFIPLWTLVVVDYFIVRRCQVRDEDLYAGNFPDGSTKSRLGDWNASGWVAMALGLGMFYLLHYSLTDAAAIWTASFPAIGVTAASYLVMTLGFNMGRTRLV